MRAGDIPGQLCAIRELQYLSLGDNELAGEDVSGILQAVGALCASCCVQVDGLESRTSIWSLRWCPPLTASCPSRASLKC